MRARSRAATRAAGDYASAAAGADRAAGTALAGPAGAASRGWGNARTPPAGMALACRGGGARRYRSRNVEDHRLARRGKRGRRRSVGEPRARADGHAPDGRRVDRPAHGEAVVQRPPRLFAAGVRLRRVGLPVDRRASRLRRGRAGRGSRLWTASACDRRFPVADAARVDGRAAGSHAPGYHMLHWSAPDYTYWVVSDLGVTELGEFSRLLRQA